MAGLAIQGARAGRGVGVGGPLGPWALGKPLNPRRGALGA
jgi:hypothetical protein